jgi:hypothetical protein
MTHTRLVAALAVVLLATLVIQLVNSNGLPAPNASSPTHSSAGRSDPAANLPDCPLTIRPVSAFQDVFEEQAEIPFEFTITNSGPSTVTITGIKPSCSCTIVNIEDRIVEPGTSVRFTAVYHARSQLGKLATRKIQVQTDCAQCPELSCEIGGTRQQRFTVTPPSVEFGIVRQGDTPVRQVTIQTHGSQVHLQPRRIIGTNTQQFELSVIRHDRSETGEETVVLEIGVPAAAGIGRIEGKLFVPRQEDDGPGVPVLLNAEVSGPVRASPSRLLFGKVRNQDGRTRSLRVVPVGIEGNELVKITGTESLPDGFTATVSDRRPDVLEVTWQPAAPGKVDHQATIACEHGGQQHRLTFRLVGTFEPADSN